MLTHYDYGFRIYNPAIGRFLSVDPLSVKFPFLTPYQFASNSPIANTDLDGLESLYYSVSFDSNGNSKLKKVHTHYGAWFDVGYSVHINYKGIDYLVHAGNEKVDAFFAWLIPETKKLNGVSAQTQKYIGKSEEYLDNVFAAKESYSDQKTRENKEREEAIVSTLTDAFTLKKLYGKGSYVKAPRKTYTKVYTTEVNVGTVVSERRMINKHHLKSTQRSAMRSLADAQKVLDNYHSGKLEVLGTKPKNGQIIVRDPSVIGDFRTNGGKTQMESNIFVIKGQGKNVTVFPKNPLTN